MLLRFYKFYPVSLKFLPYRARTRSRIFANPISWEALIKRLLPSGISLLQSASKAASTSPVSGNQKLCTCPVPLLFGCFKHMAGLFSHTHNEIYPKLRRPTACLGMVSVRFLSQIQHISQDGNLVCICLGQQLSLGHNLRRLHEWVGGDYFHTKSLGHFRQSTANAAIADDTEGFAAQLNALILLLFHSPWRMVWLAMAM